MAGKRYSAGAIFLQVVPVFQDVQKAIEDKAKDWDRTLGDQMEKSGRKAGERAGKAMTEEISKEGEKASKEYAGHFETQVQRMVKSAQRELDRLDLSTASEKMLRDLDTAKKKLRELGDTDFNLDFDTKKVLADVQAVKGAVEGLTKGEHELNIDSNLRQVIKDAAKIEEVYDKATRDREIKVHVETRQLSAFEKEFKRVSEKAAGHLEGATRKSVVKIREELSRLGDLDIGIDIGANTARREIAVLATELEALAKSSPDISVRLETAGALAELAAFEGALSKLDDVKLDRPMSAFERDFKKASKQALGHLSTDAKGEVEAVRKELARLNDLHIGVDISANEARREMLALQGELQAISMESPEIDVKLETGRAFAELAAFQAALSKLDGKDVEVDVKVDKASSSLFGAARNGEDAANSFRSFNIVMLAVAGAGPALIPVLVGIAGGLLALGPAAAVGAAGLGSVLVGFSGLGAALQAYDAVQKQQAMNAQTAAKQNGASSHAIEDAARGVADAERNAAQAAVDAAQRVKDARQSAADGIASALRQQKDAQEAYRQSVDDVKDAEAALRQARADAAGTGHDIKDKQKSNDLAIQQALLDSFDSTNNYNATMADGSSTNAEQEQARVTMEQAQQRLHMLRDEQKDLAKQQKKWDAEGVNGTDKVKTAQDQLNSALDAQRDAYQRVRDAAQAVDRARQEGAERVSKAIEAQNRTLADNARSIARAREQLARAREGQDELNASINSQASALDFAMSQLSPAGRRFARYLMGVKEDFRQFRDDIQTAMLPSIQTAMEGFFGSKSGSVLRKLLIDLAGGFGQFVKSLSKSFQGPVWLEFFRTMAKFGPDIQAAYGQAFIKVLEAFASILTTLAPYALDFANGVKRIATAFAEWAASPEGQQMLVDFMNHVKEIGPDVLKAIGMLALALINLMVALAPYSEVILSLITDLLEFIATMDPKTLGAFAAGILAVVTASQIAYSVMNTLLAGGALLRSTLGRLVFSFVGVGLAIYYVYQQNHTLGIALGVLVGGIYAAIVVMKVWRATSALVAAVQLGVAAASYGAAGATYAQAGAARAAYIAARIWTAMQWLTVAALNGTLFTIIRTNVATALMVARYYAMAAAQKVVAAGQWLLNAAMSANPLGLIVIAIIALVAAIVILWKKNDGFRRFVIDAWGKIKEAFWDSMHAIGDVFSSIGDGIMWLWHHAFKPAFDWIRRGAGTTFAAIGVFWKNILWPVLKVIMKVIWTLYKAYFKVVLTLIKVLFKAVFTSIKWVWDHVLHPVFDAIGRVLTWVWRKVVKPVLGFISDLWAREFRGMKVIWDRVLHPVFSYIGEKALPKLKSAFEVAIGAIKKIWEGLKKVVGAPIKFVLDTIINKGLIGGFNKVAGWVGMDGFKPIAIPHALQSFATGGVMPGYTPGRDVHEFYSPTAGHLRLSGGEAVMRPEWTQAMGPDYVNQMNALARSRGTKGVRQAMGLGGYWMGGVLPLRSGSVSSHGGMYGHPAYDLNYPGYSDYGKPVGAWKAGQVAQMNYAGDRSYGRWVVLNHDTGSSLYAHLSNFAKIAVGEMVRAGQTIGYVGDLGNTGNPPTSHLHFEIMGGNVDYSDTSTGGEKHRSIPSWLMGVIKDPLGSVKDWVTSGWDKAKDLTSPLFDVVKKVPLVAAKKVTDKVWDVVPGWVKTAAGYAGKAADWVVGGVKGGIHAAGELASDVGHGIANGAGAVSDFLGLHTGGILPYNGTMMYDSGGYLPPGLTTVVNLTGKPEPVFTDGQWGNLSGGAGGNIHYEPHFEGSDLSPEDVAADLNFTFRRIRRGGKYAGVGQ